LKITPPPALISRRSFALPQVGHRFPQHDFRALAHGKTGDARAHRRKRNAPQFVLGGKPQRMRRRAAQRLRTGAAAQLHAGGVNHVARLQPAAAGDGGCSDGDRADLVALLLNRDSALAANGSGHAPAELQIVVGGVDDGIHIHLRQVALQEHDLFGEIHPGKPDRPRVAITSLCPYFEYS